MRSKTGQRGFTLVELMIAVAIIAILAAIGYQVLLSSRPNMRLRSAARDIYSAMMLAKTEAMRRGENVTLLFVPAPPSYTLFVDNGAGIGGVANNEVIDGTERVLLRSDPNLPDRVIFIATPVVAAPGVTFTNNALVFTPRGIPVDAVTGDLGMGGVGLFPVGLGNPPPNPLPYWRAITVSAAGRISMQ